MVATGLARGTACKCGQPANHLALKASRHKYHRVHWALWQKLRGRCRKLCNEDLLNLYPMKYLEDKMDKVAETYSTQMRSEYRNVNRKQKTPLRVKKIILKYI